MSTILTHALRVGSRNRTLGRVKPWSRNSRSGSACSFFNLALFLATRSLDLKGWMRYISMALG